MSQPDHHGRYSFENKNFLCTLESFERETLGRFGRLFRDLKPLYSVPPALSKLGAVGGPMDGGATPKLTNAVPLGMIFFGQFIDHDITFDTTTSFSSINDPQQINNTRTAQLDLDCVFGGGPEDEPFMYNTGDAGLLLLTGKTNKNFDQSPTLEKNDLPRSGRGTAIIGDPRNDENRVISQLQLAFIRFYNAVYTDIKNAEPGLRPNQVYEKARELVTWHYHWIILTEFLPTMCGKGLVQDILGNGRVCYRPTLHAFIPVEFSVAAYRFGHTMIAQDMNLRTGGARHSIFSPEFGQGFAKVKSMDQVIDWETLFDFDGSYQRAEKLDATLAPILLNLPFIPSPNPDDRSLATRNLRRGQSFLLPSGENVAAAMGRHATEVDRVRNFVKTRTQASGTDLSAGTPLWYYILSEAEEIGRQDGPSDFTPGEGLGPVGGRIVAEVLIGLMELDEQSFLGSNRDWVPTLGANGAFTMKDLLVKAGTAVEL